MLLTHYEQVCARQQERQNEMYETVHILQTSYVINTHVSTGDIGLICRYFCNAHVHKYLPICLKIFIHVYFQV